MYLEVIQVEDSLKNIQLNKLQCFWNTAKLYRTWTKKHMELISNYLC